MITYRQPFKGEYPITQYYGETVTSSFHTGIDYACPIGTPIFASADGIIRFIGMDKTGYGNCVIIEHDATHATLYAHLNALGTIYFPNTKVQQGEVIGWSGNTGNSTGPHLHFEARKKWNDYRSHFNPIDLPLMTIDDSVDIAAPKVPSKALTVDIKPGPVEVVAPYGVYAHNNNFTSKQVLPCGAQLTFTGKTTERNNLTFCECTVWVAANDGETQLLQEY